MIVNIDIDINEILDSISTEDKNKLVKKLALEFLSTENLIELALKKDPYEKIIDYIYTNKVTDKATKIDKSLIQWYKNKYINHIIKREGLENSNFTKGACHYFSAEDVELGMNYIVNKVLELV